MKSIMIRVFGVIVLCLVLVGPASAQAPVPESVTNHDACTSELGWNPTCDVTRDGQVDVRDVQMVAAHWGETGPVELHLASWNLVGNVGTDPQAHYVGTADNKRLNLAVNGIPAVQIYPPPYSIYDAASIVAGHAGNSIDQGVIGGTISGGGALYNYNKVRANYGTIGGGILNQIGGGGYAGAIPGGAGNTVDGEFSFAAGEGNKVEGKRSFAMGCNARAPYDQSFVINTHCADRFSATGSEEIRLRADNKLALVRLNQPNTLFECRMANGDGVPPLGCVFLVQLGGGKYEERPAKDYYLGKIAEVQTKLDEQTARADRLEAENKEILARLAAVEKTLSLQQTGQKAP